MMQHCSFIHICYVDVFLFYSPAGELNSNTINVPPE